MPADSPPAIVAQLNHAMRDALAAKDVVAPLKAQGMEPGYTTPDALRELAAQALKKGTGARALRGLIEKLMLDLMYEAPDGGDIIHVKITRPVARGESQPIVRRKQDQKAA